MKIFINIDNEQNLYFTAYDYSNKEKNRISAVVCLAALLSNKIKFGLDIKKELTDIGIEITKNIDPYFLISDDDFIEMENKSFEIPQAESRISYMLKSMIK